MTTQIANFKNEIKSVAAFAKKVNFDFNTGNFDELMCNWLKSTQRLHNDIQENTDDVIRLLKYMI